MNNSQIEANNSRNAKEMKSVQLFKTPGNTKKGSIVGLSHQDMLNQIVDQKQQHQGVTNTSLSNHSNVLNALNNTNSRRTEAFHTPAPMVANIQMPIMSTENNQILRANNNFSMSPRNLYPQRNQARRATNLSSEVPASHVLNKNVT